MAENKVTFAQKMGLVMADVGALEPDSRNEHFKYAYTSASYAAGKIQAAMAAHGLYISGNSIEVLPNSTPQMVWVRTTLTISDGEGSAVGVGLGCGMDKSDKGPMKATTVGFKYALCSAFCVGMAADPEADSATDREAEQAPQRPAQAPQGRPASPRQGGSSGGTFHFGKHKGTPLHEGSPDYLSWYRDAISESVHDQRKEKFKEANIRHLAEVDEAMGRSASDAQAAASEHASVPQDPGYDGPDPSEFKDEDSLPF